MSDPFEKAKAIRKGELDSERPSFDELSGWLQRVPETWLPALLCHVVRLCVINKVFTETGLLKTVNHVIEKANKPPGLRTTHQKGACEE